MADIIAIDGPVASGKGSVSAGVAKVLGFHVLDSGALYRLAGAARGEEGVLPDDQAAVTEDGEKMKPPF